MGEGWLGVKRRYLMALGTFGAIMGFASEMVRNALEIYQIAVEKAKDPALKETLQALLKEEEKNYSLMENREWL